MSEDVRSAKVQVHEACLNAVRKKKSALVQELKNFQDAANNETKSSAGDKYETGRAMMHLEKEKVAGQLDQVLKMEQVLSSIKPERTLEQAALGALVITNNGRFFLSVSLGLIDGVICLSPVAPLGKAFLHSRAGDQVSFQGKSYQIEHIA